MIDRQTDPWLFAISTKKDLANRQFKKSGMAFSTDCCRARTRFSRLVVLFFFSTALLMAPALSRAASVNIEGRIFTESGPLEGARVYVYKSYEDVSANKPFFSTSPADAQGFYKFQLEPGEYYFTARGKHGDKRFFSYHGSNPLKLTGENLWIALMANEETQPVYSDGATSMQGVVTFKGKPVKGAQLAFYTLDAKKFKGFGFLAEKGLGFMKAAQEDGTFDIPLPAVPGRYVVIARKTKGGGGEIMPLREGDLFCYAPANPVEIKPEKMVRIEIPCYPKADRFSFVESPKIKTNDYATMDRSTEEARYGIKGRITDGRGAPVSGAYVIAYRAGDVSTPTREAVSISKTDTNGDYFVPLNADGSYGLVVRRTLGGAPKPNEMTGLYSKDPWRGINFKEGEMIEDINISFLDADRMMFE